MRPAWTKLGIFERTHAAVALRDAFHPEAAAPSPFPYPMQFPVNADTGAAGSTAAPEIYRPRLLVFLGLPHDFLRSEIDAAGRESIADEEVVGLIGIEILAFLEVGVLDNRRRQLDRLRDDLSLQRGDRRLDGDCDLRRACAGRRALQALTRECWRRICGSRSLFRRRMARTGAWRRSSPARRRCRRPAP